MMYSIPRHVTCVHRLMTLQPSRDCTDMAMQLGRETLLMSVPLPHKACALPEVSLFLRL